MKLKTFFSFILAGIVGGLVCFGAIHFTQHLNGSADNLKSVSTYSVPVTGPDFANAAELAQKVVVLIEASESEATAKSRSRQDPFQDFSGSCSGFFSETTIQDPIKIQS